MIMTAIGKLDAKENAFFDPHPKLGVCQECGENLSPLACDKDGRPLWTVDGMEDAPLCALCGGGRNEACATCTDIVTDDGSCVSCDEDHLWGVSG